MMDVKPVVFPNNEIEALRKANDGLRVTRAQLEADLANARLQANEKMAALYLELYEITSYVVSKVQRPEFDQALARYEAMVKPSPPTLVAPEGKQE